MHSVNHDDTKIKILNAAKTEFAGKGFSGARMNSIAERAGVNQALIHYYFSTKENIYNSIFQLHVAGYSEKYALKFWDELNSWNTGTELKLCAAIYMLIFMEPYFHDDEVGRIIVREIAEGNGIFYDYIVKQYFMQQLDSLEEILKEGIDKGIFEISDSKFFSANLILSIRNLSHNIDFLKYTGILKESAEEQNDEIYGLIIEFSFKALKTSCRKLDIPDIDEDKKKKLNSLLEEIHSKINNTTE